LCPFSSLCRETQGYVIFLGLLSRGRIRSFPAGKKATYPPFLFTAPPPRLAPVFCPFLCTHLFSQAELTSSRHRPFLSNIVCPTPSPSPFPRQGFSRPSLVFSLKSCSAPLYCPLLFRFSLRRINGDTRLPFPPPFLPLFVVVSL